MRIPILLMIGLGLLACLDARAEEPPAPAASDKTPSATAPATTEPAAASSAAAPATSASDTSAKPADPAKESEPEVSKETDQKLRGMGYRQSKRNGKLVYCRQEAVLGSRFSKVVCGTPSDLERVAQGAREMTEQMQHSGLNQQSRQ